MVANGYALLSKEELARLRFEEGLTGPQIADRLFCSLSTVRKYMKMYGLTMDKKCGRRPARFHVGNGEYLTAEEIAKRTGVATATIYGRINRGWKDEKLMITRKRAIKMRGQRKGERNERPDQQTVAHGMCE